MILMTKQICAYSKNYGKPDHKFVHLDEAINEFLMENHIQSENLIDIKYAPVGFFQPNGGEGELEGTALVIYQTN